VFNTFTSAWCLIASVGMLTSMHVATCDVFTRGVVVCQATQIAVAIAMTTGTFRSIMADRLVTAVTSVTIAVPNPVVTVPVIPIVSIMILPSVGMPAMRDARVHMGVSGAMTTVIIINTGAVAGAMTTIAGAVAGAMTTIAGAVAGTIAIHVAIGTVKIGS